LIWKSLITYILCQGLAGSTTGNKSTGETVNQTQLAPEASVISNTQLPQPFDSLNLKILDIYADRAIPEIYVEHKWEEIKDDIRLYDHFVHGGELHGEAGNDIRFLDESTPFYELPDIRQEQQNPGMVRRQSDLLHFLRSMLSVDPQSTLFRKAAFLGRDILDMKLSTLLRGVLAYMLHMEIFTIKEDDPGQEDYYLGLETRMSYPTQLRGQVTNKWIVLGAQTAAKVNQYCRLKRLENADYRASLIERAMLLAEFFYICLLPLTHRIPDSPTNVPPKHIHKLFKITLASLELAAKLNAYQGSSIYLREEYGAAYRYDLFDVDRSQVDEVERMSNSTKAMQRVAFTVMPAIQRTMPCDERIMTYARGIVLLQTPYVD
jgi:hypothetical protein